MDLASRCSVHFEFFFNRQNLLRCDSEVFILIIQDLCLRLQKLLALVDELKRRSFSLIIFVSFQIPGKMAPADPKEKAKKGASVVNVSSMEQFKTLTAEPRLSVVHFWASWANQVCIEIDIQVSMSVSNFGFSSQNEVA